MSTVTAIIYDLAQSRVGGKDLGAQNVSGDLTGFAGVKLDIEGHRPRRFRLLYRQVDEAMREIMAVRRA